MRGQIERGQVLSGLLRDRAQRLPLRAFRCAVAIPGDRGARLRHTVADAAPPDARRAGGGPLPVSRDVAGARAVPRGRPAAGRHPRLPGPRPARTRGRPRPVLHRAGSRPRLSRRLGLRRAHAAALAVRRLGHRRGQSPLRPDPARGRPARPGRARRLPRLRGLGRHPAPAAGGEPGAGRQRPHRASARRPRQVPRARHRRGGAGRAGLGRTHRAAGHLGRHADGAGGPAGGHGDGRGRRPAPGPARLDAPAHASGGGDDAGGGPSHPARRPVPAGVGRAASRRAPARGRPARRRRDPRCRGRPRPPHHRRPDVHDVRLQRPVPPAPWSRCRREPPSP